MAAQHGSDKPRRLARHSWSRRYPWFVAVPDRWGRRAAGPRIDVFSVIDSRPAASFLLIAHLIVFPKAGALALPPAVGGIGYRPQER